MGRRARLPDRVRHPRHPNHRLDVVDPDDVGAAGDAERDRRGRAFEPLTRRQIERLANERFPGGADQQRKTKPAQLGQATDDLEVLFARFPETNARVHDDAILCDAGRPRELDAPTEAGRDFADQVAIAPTGIVMHQHHRHAGPGNRCCHPGIAPQSPHVVHHRRAGRDGTLGHGSLIRVDRDRYGDGGDGLLQHRDHARQLLIRAQARTHPGLGPRGLTADVDQVGAVLLHLAGLADRFLEIGHTVAREGVGRDVDNPHQVGARPPMELAPADAKRPHGGRHRPERSIMSFR